MKAILEILGMKIARALVAAPMAILLATGAGLCFGLYTEQAVGIGCLAWWLSLATKKGD